MLPLLWESCLASLATWQSSQANKSRYLRGHNTTNYDVIKNDNKSLREYSNTVLDRRVLKFDNAWKVTNVLNVYHTILLNKNLSNFSDCVTHISSHCMASTKILLKTIFLTVNANRDRKRI